MISAAVVSLCGLASVWLVVRFLERRDARRESWKRDSLELRAKGADASRITRLEERMRAMELKGLR